MLFFILLVSLFQKRIFLFKAPYIKMTIKQDNTIQYINIHSPLSLNHYTQNVSQSQTKTENHSFHRHLHIPLLHLLLSFLLSSFFSPLSSLFLPFSLFLSFSFFLSLSLFLSLSPSSFFLSTKT